MITERGRHWAEKCRCSTVPTKDASSMTPSQCTCVTMEISLVGGGLLQCGASFVAGTFEVRLHKFPAKPSLNTQVALPDIVVEGRGRLHNVIVLDVER